LPKKQITELIASYPGAKNLVWAQEEPENMGAWKYMAMELRNLDLKGVYRKASAAAAEGSSSLHKKRLKRLFDDLFQFANVTAK
jgi:2-oxoglutarate dehydrogenase E1 component